MSSDPKRKLLSKKDILIVAVILAAAAVIYLFSGVFSTRSDAAAAEIQFDSTLVRTVQLKPGVHETFAVPGQPNVTLEVSGGRIRFLESTCPDKICIRAGWLSHPGEMAACLPNRVLVKIVAAGSSETDAPDVIIG